MLTKTLTLLLFLFFMFPSLAVAGTRVTFSVSIGGAVVMGAGFIYWGLSYSSTSYSRLNRIPKTTQTMDVDSEGSQIKVQSLGVKIPLIVLSTGGASHLSVPVFRW